MSRNGWFRVLVTLVLFSTMGLTAWGRPMPAPTTAAPTDEPTVVLGAPQPAPLSVQAAGKTFHMRGVIFDGAKVGAVSVNDPDTKALFSLYSATIRWTGAVAVVMVDDVETTIVPEENDLRRSDGQTVHLDTPLKVLREGPYLPVAALPLLLPGRLQATAPGQYLFDPVVTSLNLDNQEGGGVRITIEARVPMTYTTFMLRHPNRYVLNIPNVVLDLDRYHEVQTRRLQHPELGEIRFDQFSFRPNVLRLVIPTKDDLEVRVLPRSTPRKMLVTINRPSVQAFSDEVGTQRITDVKVDRSPSAVKLVLKASGPFQYEWHRLKLPDTRFFLDIPKAVLSGPRQKIAINDEWVDEIKVGQYQTEPNPTVRVLVDLEKAADMRITTPAECPNTLVLEVRYKTVSEDATGLNGVGLCGSLFSKPQATPPTPTREGEEPSPDPGVANGNGRVICIDPGHGGSDCGALNRALNIYEKDVTLDISLRLRKILAARGWHVVLTRTTDRDLTYPGSSASEELSARVRVAHAFHADLFVSIHCNSSANPSASGSSTHYYKNSDRVLAGALHPKLLDSTGTTDRGIVRNRFYVLAHCKLPSVLIETAFISNPTDGRKLADADLRQKIAEAIADGVQVYVARNSTHKTGMINR